MYDHENALINTIKNKSNINNNTHIIFLIINSILHESNKHVRNITLKSIQKSHFY